MIVKTQIATSNLWLERGLLLLAAVTFFSGSLYIITHPLLATAITQPFFDGSIRLPIADIVAVLLVIMMTIFVVSGLYRAHKETLSLLKPTMFWYGLFMVSAIVSSFLVYHQFIALSFKFVLRPLLFAYVAFFLVPALVLERKEIMLKLLRVWFGVGVLIAVYGLVSLIVVTPEGWPRVTPFPIFNIAPLGVNHNQIAEVLIALIPLCGVLIFEQRAKRHTWLLGSALSLFVLTMLLTLSRAAWIVFGMQVLCLVFWYRTQVIAWFRQYRYARYALVLALIPVVVYMVTFLQSSVVSSSTSSRQLMVEILGRYFPFAPFFGHGPGTYVPVMSITPLYIENFSVLLDAHGFIQKLLFENGVFGLIFWLAFFFWVLRFLYSTQKDVSGNTQLAARCFFLAAFGVVVFQLFNTSYFTSTMWLPLGVAFAGGVLIHRRVW